MLEFIDGFYQGTVRDFVGFFQQLHVQQEGEGEVREQEPPQHLGSIFVNVGVTFSDITVQDMRRFVSVFQSPRTCPIISTIEELNLTSTGMEDMEDAEYDSLMCQLGRLLGNLPVQTTAIHMMTQDRCTNNLLQSVSCNTHLKKFLLLCESMDEVATLILANDLIPRNPLEILSVSETNLENQGCSILMRAALDQEISRIHTLYLNFNSMTELDLHAVELLKINTRLQYLGLRGNRIGDTGAALISSALTINASLDFLNLSDCGIGDKGCSALGKALLVNETLQALDLSHNTFGDEGVHSLTSCLRHKSTMLWLGVNSCRQVTEQGARELVVLLQHYLRELEVTLEKEGEEGEDRPSRYSQHQALLDSAYDFNCMFFFSYKRVRNSDAGSDEANGNGKDEDHRRAVEKAVIRFLLPLLGSSHSLIKLSVLCLLARRDPEAAARALEKNLDHGSKKRKRSKSPGPTLTLSAHGQ